MLTQVAAALVLLLGLVVAAVGSVVPALPSVPIALVGVVLAGWITGFERIDVEFIVWTGVLTLLAVGVHSFRSAERRELMRLAATGFLRHRQKRKGGPQDG